MSRYARMNPDNPQGVPSAFREMEADAMRKGEIPHPRTPCALHPEEHKRAQANSDASVKRLGADPAFAAPIECPVCLERQINKAYDRKARLAEHAEEMVSLLRRVTDFIPLVYGGEGVKLYDSINELLSKIDSPEEK